MNLERSFAEEVVGVLQRAGHQAVFAGGCVRDELLGATPHDYDVATSAHPREVQRHFRRTVEVGVAFGVVEVLGPRDPDGKPVKIQVATFRSDGAYIDGRHPVDVVFSSAEADAQRRDFTINGIFFDPVSRTRIDYVGGEADLRAGILRAIGEPRERFREDKLRMLRAVRMATRFGLAIDPDTATAIREMAPQIHAVSAERIADELRKMLAHRRRAEAVALLDELQLVEPILPELLEMKGVPQGLPAAPRGDLWEHVLEVLRTLEGDVSFPLAFGALLHDIGKKRTMTRLADRYTFHAHEHVGKRMATAITRRLKLSNDERVRIEWLVEKHQYLSDAGTMRPAKLKPILSHPGIGELLALHHADALASGRGIEHVLFCERLLRELPPEELNPPPLITGDTLSEKGLLPGPKFKTILEAVREAQLNGEIGSAPQALEMVDAMLKGERKEATGGDPVA